MRRYILCLTPFILYSCEKSLKEAKYDEKAFYSIGVTTAQRMENLNISKTELEFFIAGFRDQTLKKNFPKEGLLSDAEKQEFVSNRMTKQSEGNKNAGEAYVKSFLEKEKDAKQSNSGLVYKITKAGDGKHPTRDDRIEVDYTASFINGEVFDKGTGVSLPVGGVIPGWQEALQLVGVGGTILFLTPPALAYGDRGMPPKVPGGSTLVFEMTVHKILKEEVKN